MCLKLYQEVWDTAIKPAGIFWGTESIGQNQHTGAKCWQWKENEESNDYDLCWGRKTTVWTESKSEVSSSKRTQHTMPCSAQWSTETTDLNLAVKSRLQMI